MKEDKEMRRTMMTGLLGGLLMAGCSSGGGDTPDAAYGRPEVSTTIVPDAPPIETPVDGLVASGPETGSACDEQTMGEDYCIRNPGTSVGGGTKVSRQNPVLYSTCRP
jgi:hypothetical protein